MGKPHVDRRRKQLEKRLARCLAANADRRNDKPCRHRAARAASAFAEQLGLIVRPRACECCRDGASRLQRHHWNYAEPLRVSFLCPDCHELADAMLRSPGDARP